MSIQEYKNHICRDTNVVDERGNVYIETGGQGCNTIWFKTVPQAQKFIDKYGFGLSVPKELCLKCQSHYSVNDPKHKFMVDFNCESWKENIAKV